MNELQLKNKEYIENLLKDIIQFDKCNWDVIQHSDYDFNGVNSILCHYKKIGNLNEIGNLLPKECKFRSNHGKIVEYFIHDNLTSIMIYNDILIYVIYHRTEESLKKDIKEAMLDSNLHEGNVERYENLNTQAELFLIFQDELLKDI